MQARPFTRSVSSIPGIRKMRPMCGLCSRLVMPSSRRLPGRSGIISRRSSSTRTNPGASPLGETSQRPSAPDVATQHERRVGDVVAAVRVERADVLGQGQRIRQPSDCLTQLGLRRHRVAELPHGEPLSGQTAASQSNPSARAMHFHLCGSADPVRDRQPKETDYGTSISSRAGGPGRCLEWNLGRRPRARSPSGSSSASSATRSAPISSRRRGPRRCATSGS